jgi:hypothetical protein
VTWEDCDQSPREIYFETDSRFGESLWCNPHAFLVGCVVPAFVRGESRVLVEEAICPELRDGLMTALTWLRRWYYSSERQLPTIEARVHAFVAQRTTAPRAGLLFSGGIDSLATLRWNRLHVPAEHPASIKDGVLIFGIQGEDAQMRRDIERQLSVIAEDAGITLIPILTNMVESLGEGVDWGKQWQGSVLAAAAHTVAGRLTEVSISASDYLPVIAPYGSHPVLDPNYSSSDLRIRHHGITLSRLAKTQLVAEWDPALQNLRVCNKISYRNKPDQGTLNCGKCEKCLRTMLALLALGVLRKTRAFSDRDVSVEAIRALGYQDVGDVAIYYNELIPLIREKGRMDLIPDIKQLTRKSRMDQNVEMWKWQAKDLDRKYLGAWLTKLRRMTQTGRADPIQGM